MLCFLLLPATHRHLCRYPSLTLRELAIADDDSSNIGDIDHPTLNRLWQGYQKVFRIPLGTAERLLSEARKKWQGNLLISHGVT